MPLLLPLLPTLILLATLSVATALHSNDRLGWRASAGIRECLPTTQQATGLHYSV